MPLGITVYHRCKSNVSHGLPSNIARNICLLAVPKDAKLVSAQPLKGENRPVTRRERSGRTRSRLQHYERLQEAAENPGRAYVRYQGDALLPRPRIVMLTKCMTHSHYAECESSPTTSMQGRNAHWHPMPSVRRRRSRSLHRSLAMALPRSRL